jgi:hypothetical protein
VRMAHLHTRYLTYRLFSCYACLRPLVYAVPHGALQQGL